MRISDWSSDVCSSDLVECFLGGARGLLALGRQYRRRTRGREISHFDRRQESDRRGLFQRHVAQRLAIFRTAADRVRRISGETMIPDFFLIDTDAMPTEEDPRNPRSEEHTSELQSLMRISSAVFCLKKKNTHIIHITNT